MSNLQRCHWCGTELPRDHENQYAGLCLECHETYETESRRSLHPMEERHPYND